MQNTNLKKWFTIFSAGLFFFYEYIQITVFNTIPKQLLSSFHISAYSLGKLSACYFIMQIILLFPAGILLDRFSAKKIILISMGISITGTLIFSFTDHYSIACFARFLSGVGGAFSFLSCIKVASQNVPKKMPLATGLLVTLAVFGGFIAQAPFAILLSYVSWRVGLQLLCVFGLLVWLNILFFLADQTSVSSEHKTISMLYSEIKSCLCNRQTFLGGLYISLMNFPIAILGALWGGLYLQETRLLTSIQASYITSMLFIGVIIGSTMFPVLSTSFFKNKKTPMQFSAVISFMLVLSIIFVGIKSQLVLSLLFFMLGVISSAQCLGYPIIIENNPIRIAATATSIASIIIMGGAALVKILFGWILNLYFSGNMQNHIPIYPPSSFNMAMLILPAGFLISLIIAFFLTETHSEVQCLQNKV